LKYCHGLRILDSKPLPRTGPVHPAAANPSANNPSQPHQNPPPRLPLLLHTRPIRRWAALRDVHRIVFPGDSITQAGIYVTDFDCWLVSQGLDIEVLRLGLASETGSDLTPEENAGHLKAHGFGRPFISERLERLLAATKPDLIIACYGMNDSFSLPPDESGTKRYADAITHLRETALKAGANRVVLCSPPVKDSMQINRGVEDENISRYTAWLMAREILTQYVGADLAGTASPEELFPAGGGELVKLVDARRSILFSVWMFKIGHGRPGSPGGPNTKATETFEQSIAKADEITKQITEIFAKAVEKKK